MVSDHATSARSCLWCHMNGYIIVFWHGGQWKRHVQPFRSSAEAYAFAQLLPREYGFMPWGVYHLAGERVAFPLFSHAESHTPLSIN